MKPMFLPGVENNPQPGPFADLIRTMRSSGSEYSLIWHMFAFKPKATDHLARFTQEIMREEAPLSPGIRELIAAYTSARNHCPFWTKSHAAVAAVLLEQERGVGGEAFVAAVLAGFETSSLTDSEKALFHFIDQVNHHSHEIGEADIAPLHAHGWTDEQIYYALTVCALFNFYNRWIDASGVHALSDEVHRQNGKRSAVAGYVRK
jgi:uncharacterized peroxidase-related enzyme